MFPSAEYIAGLFDGEGSLSFSVSKTKHGGNTAYPVVRIANCNRLVLELIQRQFGGTLQCFKPRYLRGPLNYALQVGKAQAKRFLETILPFLVIKRSLVWIVLCFLERGVKKHGNAVRGKEGWQPLIQGDHELRMGLHELVMKINSRKGKRAAA